MKTFLSRLLGHIPALLVVLTILSAAGTSSAVETITYFHNDIAGTPILATDAAGAVLWKENYRPYGDKLNNPPAGADNKLGFTGKPYDPNTGLSYMGARYYDPVIGRFTGIDPLDYDEKNLHSFNRYTYGNNNPYKYVDPDGEAAILVFIIPLLKTMAVGGATGAAVSGATSAGLQYATTGHVDISQVGHDATVGGVLGVVTGGASGAANIARGINEAKGVLQAAELSATQAKNVERFTSKLPANARDSVTLKELPNGGVVAQGVSPGRVPGSSAVYEKQIDTAGKTIQYTKTTYGPAGNIVHVKDKITGGVFP